VKARSLTGRVIVAFIIVILSSDAIDPDQFPIFCDPLLSATVALTRLLVTLSSSRVSQWQFRKPTPPLATHRLPRVGFPAFRRYYEGATTSSVRFDGLIAFGHRYLFVLSSFAHTRR